MENDLLQLINYLKDSTVQNSASIAVVKKPDIDVKSLVQDLQDNIHSDVPFKKKTSKGFDIQKFEFLLRSKLIDEYKKLQSYDRPYISVGELCSCSRKSYYERKKYEVDINEMFRFSYLALLQEVGTFVHKFIQSVYAFTENEKTVISEKYKVKGRLDSIQDSFLIEFKTVDSSDFKNTYSIRDYHQSLIYVYILNTEYGYKIDCITIVYVLRNFKKIVPFDLDINEELAKSLLSRAPILVNAIEKGEVIDPVGAVIEDCNFCLFRKFCEKDKSVVKKPYEASVIIKEKVEIKEIKEEIKEQVKEVVKKPTIDDKNETVFLL